MRLVATAHQYGPVGYRDSPGSISPSGQWLAFAISERLFLERVEGGPARELAAGTAAVRYLAWLPDERKLVADSNDGQTRWWSYDTATGTRLPLWGGNKLLLGVDGVTAQRKSIPLADLDQLSWSPDGRRVAGIAHREGKSEIWILPADGSDGTFSVKNTTLSFPAWNSKGTLACLSDAGAGPKLSFPCGAEDAGSGVPAYGGLAFSPDDKQIYFGLPDAQGTLDLASQPIDQSTAANRLTQFTNDSYAPSVSRAGAVLFKRSDYRTFVSEVDANGGAVTQLALFQSMTPSWSLDGSQIALTCGNWRRVIDDLHYPGIAQDIGILSLRGTIPASAPSRLVLASPSEDQGLSWSPDGRWIALHSHQRQSDDLWMGPADGSAAPALLTHFGRGAETDWPRWSSDGRWILVTSSPGHRTPPRHRLYLIGIDPATGSVVQPAKEIPLPGFEEEITHAEWLHGAQQIIFQSYRQNDRQTFYRVSRHGGPAAPLFHFRSDEHVAGFSVSPDGHWLAYVAPAADGFLQLFRIGVNPASPAAVKPQQLTFDASNKTQPAYSPDGKKIALTVWSYEVQFWLLTAEVGTP